MVTTPPPSGPVSEYMDLQLDYWIVSPKPDANEKEKSGKKEGNKNSLKTAFKSVSVHRLPQKSVNGEPLSSTLSMVVITKEKKQKGQYQFSGRFHFLPPVVACMTGLSHNPFTWPPLEDGKKRLRQKAVLCNHM